MYRVALLIETSKAFGRGLLAGVGRYVRLHGHWSTFVDERGLSDAIPEWVESGDFDGLIVRSSVKRLNTFFPSKFQPFVWVRKILLHQFSHE